jgi:hypothetical protein
MAVFVAAWRDLASRAATEQLASTKQHMGLQLLGPSPPISPPAGLHVHH